ncbi:unnamed protein product [Arabis nemorensis]|uniref:Uncharacterized protein n=1 Tax=Arabis nemorensis TaxID=586526 RepID=A0A565CN75_9BRAS|nr:unnamed protein product [Arabis nemorensis]
MAGGSGDGKGFDSLFFNFPFVFCDEDCLLTERTRLLGSVMALRALTHPTKINVLRNFRFDSKFSSS